MAFKRVRGLATVWVVSSLVFGCGSASNKSDGSGGDRGTAGTVSSGGSAGEVSAAGADATAGGVGTVGGSGGSGGSRSDGGAGGRGGSSGGIGGAGAGGGGASAGSSGGASGGASGGVSGPSCSGLAKNCGQTANADCCASGVVPGGTFYRGYDGVSSGATSQAFPATVSSFRLDNFEITVGRFRKFVAAYTQSMIAQGAGKNPNNPSDMGWDATNWNESLEPNATTLAAAVKCSTDYHTWTDSAGTAAVENLPMNCLNWYEAEAFCIWDGGRLPTETEWNYAASGGSDQRTYPWGNTAPGTDAKLAVYGCYYQANGTCTGVINFAPVGSIAAGNGKWGQADLAGNVWEWVQDWYQEYKNPCTNCADLTPQFGTSFVSRGGGSADMESNLLTSTRNGVVPNSDHLPSLGARCARNAP